MFAYEGREVPEGATEVDASEAADVGTCRLMVGLDLRSKHTKGLARAALEVEAY